MEMYITIRLSLSVCFVLNITISERMAKGPYVDIRQWTTRYPSH